ncbi:MAG: tetratricopeptide repeat protein [Cyanobacteriota bacterium]
MINNKGLTIYLITFLCLIINNTGLFAQKFNIVDELLETCQFNQAENILKTTDLNSLSNRDKAEYYNTYARYELEKKNLDKSLEYLNLAEGLLTSTSDKDLLAETYVLMSADYLLKADTDNGYKYLIKAEAIALNNNVKYSLGEVYEIKGLLYVLGQDYLNATLNYEQALEIFESLNNKRKVLEINNLYAEALFYTGDIQNAISLFESVASSSKVLNIPDESSKAYLALSTAYMSLGDIDKTIEYANKAIEEANKANDIENMIQAHAILATYYTQISDNEKAVDQYIKIVDLAEQFPGENIKQLLPLYVKLSGIMISQDKYDKAEILIKKALKNKQQLSSGDLSLLVNNYSVIATKYMESMQLEKTLMCLIEILEVSKEYNLLDEQTYNAMNTNIANLYKMTGKVDIQQDEENKEPGVDQPLENETLSAAEYSKAAAKYINQANFDKALELYFKALKIQEQNPEKDFSGLVEAYNNIASLYDKQGKYDEAINWYTKALDKYKSHSSETTKISEMINQIGMVYTKKEEYAKALEEYNKAINVLESQPNPDQIALANIYNNIAVLFDYQGKYNKALDEYNKVLNVYKKELGEDHLVTATLYNNVGAAYSKLEKYDLALENLNKALTTYKNFLGEDNPELISIYNNIGDVYIQQGKPDQALDWFFKNKKIAEKSLGNDNPLTSSVYNAIAIAYSDQKEYEKAIDYFEKALKIRSNAQGEDHSSLATIYNNLAQVYYYKKQLEKSIEAYQKALKISIKAFGESSPDVGNIYNNIGVTYEDLKQYDKALESLNKGLEIRKTTLGETHPDVAESYNNIAILYKNMDDLNNSELFINKAIELSTKTNNDFRTALYKGSLATVLKYKGNYQRSLDLYNETLEVLENQRQTFVSESDKLKITNDIVDYFESCIFDLFKLQQPVLGFDYSERSKARNLIQAIASSDAKFNAGISTADFDRLNSLEKQVNDSQKLCYSTDASERMAEYTGGNLDKKSEQDSNDCEQYRIARKQLSEFKKELDIKYPKYYELRFPSAKNSEELVSLFNKPEYRDTLLVEYFVGRYNLYVWLVSKDGINGYKYDIKKEDLESIVDTVTGPLKAASYAGNFDSQIKVLEKLDLQTSNKLYNILLKPINSFITDTSQYKNLIIVPHGILYYLPFESLVIKDYVEQQSDNDLALSKYKNAEFLGTKINVSYLPSASILSFLEKNKRKEGNTNVFIAANPEISYLQNDIEKLLDPGTDLNLLSTRHESSVTTRALDNRSSLLLSLPNSEIEGKFIKDLYNDKATLLLGKQATEKAVRDNIGQYGIYHISSHGIMDDQNPYMSGLVLSKDDNAILGNNKGIDGILYAYELSGSNLNADTVVLSACDTGLGKVIDGEGMVGLSRAFLISGANSLIISLWQVSDASTSELMKNFYLNKEDMQSLNKSDALRRAKLKLIDSANTDVKLTGYKGISYAHPYYWAPFILSGNWR